MGKSEALKRVQVECVEEIVDEAMKYLPLSLDLAVPDNRKKVRDWMVRICTTAMRQSAYTIRSAAENAISEAIELVIDNRYYEKKEERRKVRAAKKKALREKSAKPPGLVRAEYEFERLSGKAKPQ